MIEPHAPGDELCRVDMHTDHPCEDEDGIAPPEGIACGSCGACVCVRCYSETCPECEGDGILLGSTCANCDGTGSVPGDPAHYQGCDQGVAT